MKMDGIILLKNGCFKNAANEVLSVVSILFISAHKLAVIGNTPKKTQFIL